MFTALSSAMSGFKVLPMKTASWVIIRLSDNSPIFETFSESVALAVNQSKYKSVPILQYLVNFNKGIKS
jgi:hypothetical protein